MFYKYSYTIDWLCFKSEKPNPFIGQKGDVIELAESSIYHSKMYLCPKVKDYLAPKAFYINQKQNKIKKKKEPNKFVGESFLFEPQV